MFSAVFLDPSSNPNRSLGDQTLVQDSGTACPGCPASLREVISTQSVPQVYVGLIVASGRVSAASCATLGLFLGSMSAWRRLYHRRTVTTN